MGCIAQKSHDQTFLSGHKGAPSLHVTRVVAEGDLMDGIVWHLTTKPCLFYSGQYTAHLLVLFFRLIRVKLLSRNMTCVPAPGSTNLSTHKSYYFVQIIFQDIMKFYFIVLTVKEV